MAKNPKIEFSFRCVKLRENPENLGFTFFGFSPLFGHFRLSRVLQTTGFEEIYRLI